MNAMAPMAIFLLFFAAKLGCFITSANELSDTVRDISAKFAAMEKEINNLRLENGRLLSEVVNIKSENKNLRYEVEALKLENKQTGNEMHMIKVENIALRSDVEQLKEDKRMALGRKNYSHHDGSQGPPQPANWNETFDDKGSKNDDFRENSSFSDKEKSEERRLLAVPSTTTSPQLGTKIGFLAYVTSHQQNLGIHQTVEFKTVVTNIGSGYNPSSSVFRAPVEGLYYFSVTILSFQGDDMETEIVHNGNGLVYTYSGSESMYGSGSASAVVHLNANDDVWVRILNVRSVNDGNIRVFYERWSSFCGFRIG